MPNVKDLLAELSKPFPPSAISWKPGASKDNKCMALAYADLRAYQDRLDEVMGVDWSCRYVPWEGSRIICELTLYVGGPLDRREAILRSSTGDADKQDEKNELAASVAEAQSFKRACAMFGLGRYLYELPSPWVEFDPAKKRITEAGQRELDARYATWFEKKMSTLAAQDATAAQRALTPVKVQTAAQPQKTAQKPSTQAKTDVQHDPAAAKLIDPFNALGEELYADQWPQVRERNARRVSEDRTQHFDELKAEELQALIHGMTVLKNKRLAEVNVETSQPVAH